MIYNYQTYYFDKNTLGDIVAIRNVYGMVVATYEYDAWGKVTVMNENGVPTMSEGSIGNINPFRYRGYYYDSETGFYYLQTRYYDPETCRFINADDYELIAALSEVPGQLNLYSYCNNNPIMYTDPSGEFVLTSFLIGLGIAMAIGAGVGATAYVASEVIAGSITGTWSWSWSSFVGAILGGAIGGAFSMIPGIGAIGTSFITGFSSSMIGMNLQNAWEGSNYNFRQILLTSAMVGGVSAVTAGIMGSIKITGINAGRGSLQQVSNQIRTKFINGTNGIRHIANKTFAKMFALELYGSALGSITDGFFSAFDWNDKFAQIW